MIRSSFRVAALMATLLAFHGPVFAAQRTYVNDTKEKLVIWVRLVVGEKFGEWTHSDVLDPEAAWPVTLNDPAARYDFVLEFPDSNNEKKRLGVKQIKSKDPLTFSVVRREKIVQHVTYDSKGRPSLQPPVREITYDLVPEGTELEPDEPSRFRRCASGVQ